MSRRNLTAPKLTDKDLDQLAGVRASDAPAATALFDAAAGPLAGLLAALPPDDPEGDPPPTLDDDD